MSNKPQVVCLERRRDERPWYESTLGQYVLQREMAYIDSAVSDLFGFNALQLGLAQYDLLRANRIAHRLTVGPFAPAQLYADFDALPIASQSIDLALLPHILEFAALPHQVLREVERILIPEGHVLITGFNPLSLWGGYHLLRRRSGEYPWRNKFISLQRLKDWLALLGLEVTEGKLTCYAPPLQSAKWLARFHFMEAAGDRWWPLAGGVYCLLAKKRVHSMRLILPAWSERAAARRGVAPVAQKGTRQAQQERERDFV